MGEGVEEMSATTIQFGPSVRAEIKRQAGVIRPPARMTEEDRQEFLASMPVEHQVEAEEHLNRLADRDDEKRLSFMEGAVVTITKLLSDADLGRFQKPLLTIEEAASMLSLSRKRFDNIICQERSRLGRSPDFIVDAGGRISRRVLRDELITWAKRRGKNDRRRIEMGAA